MSILKIHISYLQLCFAFFASMAMICCKRSVPDGVFPKSADKVVRVDPPYWCAKTAVFKMGEHEVRYEFSYNEDSQLKRVKTYTLDKESGGFIRRSWHYYYEGGLLREITDSIPGDGILQVVPSEDAISLWPPASFSYNEAGKVNQITYPEDSTPVINIRYTDTTEFRTSIDHFANVKDTTTYLMNRYPDSLTIHWKYYRKGLRAELKEVKKENVIFFGTKGRLELSDRINHFNPKLWKYFDSYFDMVICQYSDNGGTCFQVLSDNEPYNNQFIKSKSQSGTKVVNTYQTDSSGRVTGIFSRSDNAGEAIYFDFDLTFTY